jgi:NAD(P)-dependent dehydrogenase (short-subunit alcohol dehydrogenase family)
VSPVEQGARPVQQGAGLARRFRLDGRNALVTGGGRGIGRAIALGLAEAGAGVCVTSRSAGELASACQQITALGGRAAAVVADLLDPAAIESIVPAMVGELGSVDILVNNAGQAALKDPFPVVSMTDWERHLRLLLTVHVSLTQQAVRWMTGAGRPGAVVNVASIYGLAGAPGGEKELGSVSYYTAAKHGLVGFTRALAIEVASAGIRVNALCPGWVDTSMNPISAADPAFIRRNLDQIPMGRWATADEMAGPAVFLASDASSFMTGQTLVVDGGHLA